MKTSRVKKIYVAEYNGNFKIGVSNNVATRIGQLACGCPTIKLIYKSDFISNAFELEAVLHNLYKDKCVGGEWFSYVDAEEIKRIIEEHGSVADYEQCKKEENEIIEKVFDYFSEKFLVIPKSNYTKDDRNMGVFQSSQWLVDKFRNRYVLLCCIYQASKAIREHAFVNWI